MANEYRPAPMSLAQRAALRQQEPRALYKPARRRVYPLVLTLVLLGVLVVAAGGFEYLYRDRVLPRVQIQTVNIDVGGQTRAATAQSLLPFALSQGFRVIALIARGSPPLLVPASTLGYRLDRDLTAWRAYNVGHGGSLLHRVKEQVTTLLKGTSVPLAQRVDQHVLGAYLSKLAARFNRTPHRGVAGRRLDGAGAQTRVTKMLLAKVGVFKVYLPFTTLPALPRLAPAHHQTKHKPRKSHVTSR